MAIRFDDIGDRLKAFRLGSGLGADEVAKRIGISRTALYRFEKGELVKSETLERLAELEFDVLCGGHGRALRGGASDKFRDLLAARPEPPTWGDMLKSMPRRILGGKSLSGEQH